ncbi:MAG: filamentous hemagglutinin N-terminal domain-containing protein, partial [Deltaproteobacteria bacterium]|nr:filamentous hemagglutinin N-terminal domain-containing protein [Deltaproteobacteria bacterium]
MQKVLFRKKGISIFLIFMIYAFVFPVHIFALPQGGQVVAGQADISRPDAGNMHINQGTDKAIINWQSFSIAQPESVRFFQPSASSIALNRVIGVDPSLIYGRLSANGRVWVINPNGIMVGATGKINVNSFLASTLDMANDNFLAGNYVFSQTLGSSLASIVNQGTIQAAQEGFVSLLAPGIKNEGTIVASLGKVYLGSGEQMTINFAGNDLIGFAVDKSVMDEVVGPDGEPLESNIENTGEIYADGGEVILSAKTAYDAIKSVINNEGIIEAKSFSNKNGKIVLKGGDQGIVENSGVLDASGKEAGQTGGEVQVLGDKVGLFDTASIDVSGDLGGGIALIGGDFQGSNPDIQNASRTYVGPDATITAEAYSEGDGGKVIVWADEVTRFYGDIYSTGGIIRGDGGFAEVSGKETLIYRGSTNLSAIHGNVGTLLLDPNVLHITSADGTDNSYLDAGSADPIFAFGEGTEPSNITAAHLVSELNIADITLQANTQIDVDTAVDASGNTGNAGNSYSLELDSITINFIDGANILLNNADLTIGNSAAGNVALADGATVSLNTGSGGGNITINGTIDGNVAGSANLSLTAGTGNVSLSSAVGGNTALGNFTVTSANQVDLNNITVSNANIGITGTNIDLNGTVYK